MKKTVKCESFIAVEGELKVVSGLSIEEKLILSGNLRQCMLGQLFLGTVDFTAEFPQEEGG